MKIYAAYKNSDLTEGRGVMILDLAFRQQAHALEYIEKKNNGGWGWEFREIDVLEGPYDEMAELRRNALAKLTAAEKKALGL